MIIDTSTSPYSIKNKWYHIQPYILLKKAQTARLCWQSIFQSLIIGQPLGTHNIIILKTILYLPFHKRYDMIPFSWSFQCQMLAWLTFMSKMSKRWENNAFNCSYCYYYVDQYSHSIPSSLMMTEWYKSNLKSQICSPISIYFRSFRYSDIGFN